jgi:iron complex transport system ATP-binding protein
MRGTRLALDELTIRIPYGEHAAILGPNGSGKSTLIKAITRECYPLIREGSSMTILGRSRWNVFELRHEMGIVSNDLAAACARNITGTEAVLSGFFSSIGVCPQHAVTKAMREKAAETLALLEISHLAGRYMNELSSGEAHRVLIGRALVHSPRVLLLDEPSNSLDLFAQQELRTILRKLARSGLGILLVTHQLSDIIPEIERVILMRNGRVFRDGGKAENLAAPVLTELFGLPVDLARRDGYFHAW